MVIRGDSMLLCVSMEMFECLLATVCVFLENKREKVFYFN